MLDEHLSYVSDRQRMARFRQAVATTIHVGESVADLGCGTGILGLLCLQHGAGHLTAIDETPMIEVARESFRREGFADRVSVHAENSHRLKLADPVDVVICDQVGYFGFDYGILETLADARARLLAPNGRMIPQRLDLYLAAVGGRSCRRKRDGWHARNIPPEFGWLQASAVNQKYAVRLKATDLRSEPMHIASFTLGQPVPEFHAWSADLFANHDGDVDGLLGWFRAELADGVWMTNSPLERDAIRRSQAYLPISSTIAVNSGDSLRATVMARPRDQQIGWRLEHAASGNRFEHSTFGGSIVPAGEWQRAGANHVPLLTPLGRVREATLRLCDGRRSVAEIQLQLCAEFRDLLPGAELDRFVERTLRRDAE